MFEPNSIRSLLSKRNSSRAQSATSSKQQQSSPAATGLDPDYDTVIEVKLMTKQIQNKIESIRQWRQHQKQLMEQQLKSNAELAHQINSVHMRNLEKQAEREEAELKKILEKLKDNKAEIKIEQKDEIYDSERIFNVLNETDNLREALKSKNQQITQVQTTKAEDYNSLVNQMDKINYIFNKDVPTGEKTETTEPEKLDRDRLQKQMDQIENQLREIEDLLGDDDQKKGKSKGKK